MSVVPNEYTLGQVVKVHANLQSGSPLTDVDPATIAVKIRAPGSNTVTTKTYPADGEVDHDGLGQFSYLITTNKVGRWYYRFESTGTVSAEEHSFIVRASRF